MESLSLFTGIGGFDLGFERAGITSTAMCEIEGGARSVLNYHWSEVPVVEDINLLDGKDYYGIEVVHGGFPCQDISFSGNREGLAGTKSGLWWEYHRVIREARPKWVVIENVYGLLSSGGRRDLGAIVRSLAELGYLGSYRVLDSRFFGVPHRRRRVFIVGCLGGAGGQQVLFESSGSSGGFEQGSESSEVVSGTVSKSSEKACFSVTDGYGVARVLPDSSVPLAFHPSQEPIVSFEVSNSISTGTTVGGKATVGIFDGQSLRKVTPRECERLQGFPDDWTLNGVNGVLRDSQRYRYLGNSVTVNVAEWLGKRIVKFNG